MNRKRASKLAQKAARYKGCYECGAPVGNPRNDVLCLNCVRSTTDYDLVVANKRKQAPAELARLGIPAYAPYVYMVKYQNYHHFITEHWSVRLSYTANVLPGLGEDYREEWFGVMMEPIPIEPLPRYMFFQFTNDETGEVALFVHAWYKRVFCNARLVAAERAWSPEAGLHDKTQGPPIPYQWTKEDFAKSEKLMRALQGTLSRGRSVGSGTFASPDDFREKVIGVLVESLREGRSLAEQGEVALQFGLQDGRSIRQSCERFGVSWDSMKQEAIRRVNNPH